MDYHRIRRLAELIRQALVASAEDFSVSELLLALGSLSVSVAAECERTTGNVGIAQKGLDAVTELYPATLKQLLSDEKATDEVKIFH